MSHLIPTKAQWDGWTMPSKVTYIGTCLGAFSIILAISLCFLSWLSNSKTQSDIELIKQEMEAYNQTNAPLLEKKYPLGYILFAIHNNRITKWEPENSKLKIDFNSAKILKVSNRQIYLRLPGIESPYYKYNEIAHCRMSGVDLDVTTNYQEWIISQQLVDSNRNPIRKSGIKTTTSPMKEKHTEDGVESYFPFGIEPNQGLPEDSGYIINPDEVLIGRRVGAKFGLSFFGQKHETWIEVLVDNKNHTICVFGIKENTYTTLVPEQFSKIEIEERLEKYNIFYEKDLKQKYPQGYLLFGILGVETDNIAVFEPKNSAVSTHITNLYKAKVIDANSEYLICSVPYLSEMYFDNDYGKYIRMTGQLIGQKPANKYTRVRLDSKLITEVQSSGFSKIPCDLENLKVLISRLLGAKTTIATYGEPLQICIEIVYNKSDFTILAYGIENTTFFELPTEYETLIMHE